MRINYGQEENTNEAYGSGSGSKYRLDKDDTARGGRSLDTLDTQANSHGFYSSSISERHHRHYCQHPYRRSEKQCLPKEFKKAKPCTFHGDVKKLEDAKAWVLGMKKFFRLHDYSKNMKAKIVIFSLKGKLDILWEDVKRVRVIRVEELSWNEFER